MKKHYRKPKETYRLFGLSLHLCCIQDTYFSMEVLADKNYRPIKQKLDELEDEGIIGYAEPCLSDIHREQI